MAHNTRSGFPRPEDARGPLAVARKLVVETAANTLSEEEIPLPIDPQLGIGALIRRVKFQVSTPPILIPAADSVSAQSVSFAVSTRQGQTTIPAAQTPGTLAAGFYTTRAASQLADSGVTANLNLQGDDWEFRDFGLLVATKTLSIYVEGSGLLAAANARAVIFFHLVDVEAMDLLAAISTISDVT